MEQCLHRHRFENQRNTARVLSDWIQICNHRRPHRALGMKNPARAYALAAKPVQNPVGHYMFSKRMHLNEALPSNHKAR
jgi:hypothetical protein